MALVAALSMSHKGLAPISGMKKTANILLALLSSHPVQLVRNAAYYALQHLLDSLQVRDKKEAVCL